MEFYGNASEAIGCDKHHWYDDATIEALNPRIKRMLSNVLHDIGMFCQNTNRHEDAALHLQKAVKIKNNVNAPMGSSVLLLGKFHHKLKDYDHALEKHLLAKIELKFEETECDESHELYYRNIACAHE